MAEVTEPAVGDFCKLALLLDSCCSLFIVGGHSGLSLRAEHNPAVNPIY